MGEHKHTCVLIALPFRANAVKLEAAFIPVCISDQILISPPVSRLLDKILR